MLFGHFTSYSQMYYVQFGTYSSEFICCGIIEYERIRSEYFPIKNDKN